MSSLLSSEPLDYSRAPTRPLSMNTLLLLLPDLALIATGAALARWVQWSEGFWSSLEKLVYYVLFPALLFTAIVRNRIDPSSAAPFAFGVLAVLLFGIALGALGGRLFGIEDRRFGGAVDAPSAR